MAKACWAVAVLAGVLGCTQGQPAAPSASGLPQPEDATPLTLPDPGSPADPGGTPGPGADGGEGDGTDAAVAGDTPTVSEEAATGCTVAPDGLGCPCAADENCKQPGFCVPSDTGKVCTIPCVDSCPVGYDCVGVMLGLSVDTTYLCLPRFAKLCQPCEDANDCLTKGDVGVTACLDYGEAGRFCGAPCAKPEDCPPDYECTPPTPGDGNTSSQCVRAGGPCTCNALGSALGMATTCQASNGYGQCAGKRTCGPGGLSVCDAPVPAPEVCNGADDDCDGTADVLPAASACLATNDFGSCPGKPTCAAGSEVCVTDTPATKEDCDGVDDDCDGTTDEGFVDTDADLHADCVDDDDDGDGVGDDADVCPLAFDPGQEDTDGDLLGDACDDDDDGDGTLDAADCAPKDETAHPGATEVCDGVDNDCDDQTDEALCEDQNPCTKDLCDGVTHQCTHAFAGLEGAPCDADGDLCTQGDSCQVGVCAKGAAVICPASADPCTVKVCQSSGASWACVPAPADPGTACEDEDPCTTGDQCDAGGACVSGPPKVGCCLVAAGCQDGDACTLDLCSAVTHTCKHLPASDGSACDADASGCTQDDTCIEGVCVPGVPAKCALSPGACVVTKCTPLDSETYACKASPSPSGASCDDGALCTGGDSCDGQGQCVGTPLSACCTSAADCDDQNPCTKNSCNTLTGKCVQADLADGTLCDADGNGCTEGDACTSGVCAPGKAAVCNAGAACYLAQCSSVDPTSHVCTIKAAPAGTACDDGAVCTGADQCDGNGQCAGFPVAACCKVATDCDDKDPCTKDLCDVAAGKCQHPSAANGTPCDADGNGCTEGDTCAAGACLPGATATCSSGGACFVALCATTGPSTHTCTVKPAPSGTMCDDGAACTSGDQCDGNGACTGAPVLQCCKSAADCDDGNACTLDACEASQGKCTHTKLADGVPCDADGSGCTGGDKCSAGACQAGPAVSCAPPAAACTVAACASTGPTTYSCTTQPAPYGTVCSDNTVCTTGDQCDGLGTCSGKPVAGCCLGSGDCNDGNACTVDTCDAGSGVCKHANAVDGTECNADSSGCTATDACQAGVCKAGAQVSCASAADACHTATCGSTGNTTYQCVKTAKAPGTACDDGLWCTLGESCAASGTCSGGTPRDCGAAAGPCKPASCDEVTDQCAVITLLDGTPCSDGDACTVSDTCLGGECGGGVDQCGEEPLSVTVKPNSAPDLAALPGGRYVARWADTTALTGPRAAVRLSDAHGSRENEEETLNATSDGKQFGMRPAVDPNGNYLTLHWSGASSGGCSSTYSGSCQAFLSYISGRKYSPTQTKLAENKNLIMMSAGCCGTGGYSCTRAMSSTTTVPMAFSDGTFAVLVEMLNNDTCFSGFWTTQNIRFVPVGSDLSAGTQKTLVNNTLLGVNVWDGAVVPDGTNKFVVAYVKVGQVEVDVQRFLKDGTADYPSPAVVVKNTDASAYISATRVVAFTDGKYLVLWQVAKTASILGQRLYSDGSLLGSPFKVNLGPAGTQSLGDVGVFSDKSFVVVYEDSVGDGAGYGIRAQRFQADGTAIGGPMTVNTLTPGDQRSPTVATLSTDEFVVAWNDGTVVRTRRFFQNGTPSHGRTEAHASTTGIGAQSHPSAAATDTGSFLVAYDSPKGGQTSGEILGRVFDATGGEVAAEATLNTTTAGAQYEPAVAGGSNRLAVAWTSNGQDGAGDGIVWRLFDGKGAAVTAEVVANTTTAGTQKDATVAMLATGQTFVAWTGDAGAALTDVVGRVFGADGAPTSAEVTLNSLAPGNQGRPAVAATKDGFVAAFEAQAATGYEVHLRRVGVTGAPIDPEAVVSSAGYLFTDQRNPAVVVTAGGQIVVCFEGLTTDTLQSWDLVCRVFGSDLSPLTLDFKPPAALSGAQRRAALTRLTGGDFVVAWDTEYVDTTGTAVEYQRYTASGQTVGTRVVANRTWVQNQDWPFLVGLPNATVVAGWQSEGQDGDLYGVYMRLIPAP